MTDVSSPVPPLSTASRAILFVIIVVAAFAGGLAIRATRKALTPPVNQAEEARKYLQERGVTPLAKTPEETAPTVATQPHPLLSQKAPDFTLNDDANQPRPLDAYLQQGNVVLVFYFGYHCNHCVAQLFAIHDDIERFRELGAQVVAVSADDPADTRQRFADYGRFNFPVLSDPANVVAEKYGVYTPRQGDRQELLQHGTFVIDRTGVVRWCNFGEEPFVDNATLLAELQKLPK